MQARKSQGIGWEKHFQELQIINVKWSTTLSLYWGSCSLKAYSTLQPHNKRKTRAADENNCSPSTPQCPACPWAVTTHQFPLHFYCWASCPMVQNVPVVSCGELSWLRSLPTSCAPSALSLVQWGEQEKKSSVLCKLLLTTNWNNPVLIALLPAQTQITAPCKLLWKSSALSQAEPVQTIVWIQFKE